MKITFLEENTVTLSGDIDLGRLRFLGEYEGLDIPPSRNPIPASAGAEILVINKTRMTRERIGVLEGLRLICVAATGYDNVDIEAAREAGVHVANVRGYATDSVAQQVFSFILRFYMKIEDYADEVRRGEWSSSQTFHLLVHPTGELAGKTLGVVGFGAIGRRVAELGAAFRMRVLVHDVEPVEGRGYEASTLKELLARSDVVSIHCPLTEETRHMIGREQLGLMRSGAILVNTARGGIVEESALADALNAGVIAGAGVDTLSVEPPVKGNALLNNVRNLYVTPHVAWATRESRQRVVDGVADNIERSMRGDLSSFIV